MILPAWGECTPSPASVPEALSRGSVCTGPEPQGAAENPVLQNSLGIKHMQHVICFSPMRIRCMDLRGRKKARQASHPLPYSLNINSGVGCARLRLGARNSSFQVFPMGGTTQLPEPPPLPARVCVRAKLWSRKLDPGTALQASSLAPSPIAHRPLTLLLTGEQEPAAEELKRQPPKVVLR